MILVSLLASSAFAQKLGKWQTTAESNELISSLTMRDGNRMIAVKHENNLVSFIIENPKYLRTQGKDLKAMIRFDSGLPRPLDMQNVDHREAVVTREKARELIKQLAASKKMAIRIYNLEEFHCWDLAFITFVLKLPSDTPQVLGEILGSSN
jgi:hypothetical protein